VNLKHPFVEFRPSLIHGFGGFALAAIPAGSRIMEYVGERISKEQSLERCMQNNGAIFCLDDQWDLDGSVEWNPARFFNHSCSPNCDAEEDEGRIWVVARRQIEAGEEITFNYGYDLEDYREHPCRCGAPACLGYMVAEEFFDAIRAG
jgi:SET domain-containing protein